MARRTGVILIFIGAFFAWHGVTSLWAFSALAVATGLVLIAGGMTMAKWVHALATACLATGLTLPLALLLLRPLNLMLTEVRLDPASLAWPASGLLALIAVPFWVRRELTGSIDDAWPAQAGAGLTILVAILSWLPLHGQSGATAAALALQTLGPGYRYQLTAIRRDGDGQTSGVVTAWNDQEIKTMIVHWQGK